MPIKFKPVAFEKVEMTEEERQHKNKVKREYRRRLKEENPEKYKEEQKIQNRKNYLRRKQKLEEAKKSNIDSSNYQSHSNIS